MRLFFSIRSAAATRCLLVLVAIFSALAAPARAFVFDSFGDGFWNAVNQNNSKALVVTSTGASQAAVATTDFGQQFEVLLNLEDGTFRIRNRDTLKCIGALNGGTTAGTAVVEINYTGANSQRWSLIDVGSGFYQVVNVAANLALQTDAAATANVTLQVKSTSNLQRWKFNYITHYPKKGGAGWDGKWDQFNVSWCYNWSDATGAYLPDARVFEPMKYSRYWPGTGNLGGGYAAMHSTPKPVFIMGFNEPDQTSQGDTPVADAISLWPELQNQNVPLVSPAATNAYNGWLGDFYTQVGNKGYRVDFTAVHWYANPSADTLINHLQSVYNSWGRPIWLTEFGAVDWAGNQTWTEEDDWRFLAEFMWRAENLIWLKRYSMFVFTGDPPANPWSRVGSRSNMMKSDNNTLTSIGELYAGWDGDQTIRPRTAYLLQGQNSMHRLSSSAANSGFPAAAQYPSPVSIRFGGAQAQWAFVQSPTSGQFYIVSLLDGRRLRTDGNGVDLAPIGTTGIGVQWNLSSPDAYGYCYIDNANFTGGKALYNQRWNNGDGSPNSIYYGVQASGNASDITRFRFVKPGVAVAVPDAPVAPTAVAAAPGDRSVALSWSGEGFIFTVSRSTSAGGPYTVVASGIQTRTFTDNTALNGTPYYYVVSATNIVGETSVNSAQVAATPLASLNGAALMANYKFESGDASDRSARGQHGAVSGGVTFTAPGKVDSAAATFDGIDGSIQIPVVVANDFTIAFWMKTTATGGAGTQWYSGNGLVDGEVGGAGADFGTSLLGSKVAFGVGNPDTTIQSPTAVNDGAWHHVAVTRNGTSGAMQLFLDGVPQASATGPTGTRTLPTSLRIGSIQTGVRFFSGSLDEIRLYNYALTSAEIARLFRPRNAPVAVYSFENNALDSSGFGNHGAVAGGISYGAGNVGQVGQFNGAGNSVVIPSPLVNDFSIAYWIKTTATAGTGQWWSGAGIVDGEVSGAVNDFGTALIGSKAAFGVGNADTTITSTSAINDGQWHHVTATRASGSGAMKLFVDGLLQATGTGPTGSRTAPNALRIAGMQPGYGYLAGALDEVRLYTYPLSAGQVFAMANPAPAPWLSTDIGAPAADGFAGRNVAGTWSVGGSGADIWTTADQFQFVNQPANGDGSIVARVTSLPTNPDSGTTANSKAGVMFRATTAANSQFVDLVFDTSQGLQFTNRATAGAAAAQPVANVNVSTAPFWLRLTRGGNIFQAAYTTVAAPAASDWILIGNVSVGLPTNALAGLAVTSHADGIVADTSFTGAALNANQAPTISAVANQTISENAATSVLPFTIADFETPAANLIVTATSSNTTLVPTANITLGGSGASRTVRVTPASNQSGTATITLNVSDGTLVTTSAFVVTVQTTPVGSWRQQWFGSTAETANSADAADPDRDGISNLWERAFNLDPTAVDSAATAWPVVGENGANLTLIYRRNTAATDITYQVLWSDDLATWSATGVTDSLFSSSGNTQTRMGQIPMSLGARIYLRLKITTQP